MNQLSGLSGTCCLSVNENACESSVRNMALARLLCGKPLVQPPPRGLSVSSAFCLLLGTTFCTPGDVEN